jgi:hypothetical protein
MNPDALVARVNIERARAGYELDVLYLTSLSGDAVPRLVEALPDLEEEDRCAVKRILEAGREGLESLESQPLDRLARGRGGDAGPAGPVSRGGTPSRPPEPGD